MSEFKVGDIVKRKADCLDDSYWQKDITFPESNFRVRSVSDNGGICPEYINGEDADKSNKNFHWKVRGFELVGERRNYKYNFNKGDVVRHIKNCHQLEKDDICVVEEEKHTSSDGTTLKVFNRRTKEINDYNCIKYLELAEDSNPESQPSEYNGFRVGDIILRTSNREEYLNLLDNVKIIGIDLKRAKVTYRNQSGHVTWFILELLTPENFTTHERKSDMIYVQSYPCEFKHSKENTMDVKDLKNFNPDNLAEGKTLAVEEQTNYELQEAKKVFVKITDDLQTQERVIRDAQEKVKELKKDLAVFGKE